MPEFELALLDVLMVAVYVVGMAGDAPDPETIEDYTWNRSHLKRELATASALPWYKNFFIQSGVLLALVSGVLVLFW